MNTIPAQSLQNDVVPPIIGTSNVYFLPTIDRSRLKIGQSSVPPYRINGLSRVYPEIDLTRAVIVEVDAPQIETALHIVFSDRREILPVRADGYTEWFVGDFIEEALTVLDTIARHRGIKYRVIRNVDSLLANFRAQNPNAGKRTPRLTRSERSVRAELAKANMCEAVVEHAQHFCDRIAESDFDSVVRCSGHAYLARTVYRANVPECWDSKSGHHGSFWGQRFAEASFANVKVYGGMCVFPMLNPPIFGAVDDTHGREYFRICQDRPVIECIDTLDLFSPLAFDELWRLLDKLPVVELPGEWPDLPTSVATRQ